MAVPSKVYAASLDGFYQTYSEKNRHMISVSESEDGVMTFPA